MNMGRLRRFLTSDDGFSLTEVIVVIGLLPLVLAGAYGALNYTTTSSAVSAKQGNAARDFASPLEQMSSTIMQNTSIKSAGVNRIEVWTDRDMDGAPELDAFYVTSDNRLVFERWGYTSDRLNVVSHNTWDLSSSNYNVGSNTPLFTYYDKTGAVIDSAQVAVKAPSNATRVRVRLMVDTGDGNTLTDIRDILFRNRS